MRAIVSIAIFLCLLVAVEAAAQKAAPAKSEGELIGECMRSLQKNLKTGQRMSEQQRMIAEQQCRASARTRL